MKRLMGLLMLAVMTISALVGCGGGGGGGGVTGVQMGGSIQGVPLSLHRAVTTLAGTAAASGSTDGAGAAARFYLPSGITTDGTNLFVAVSGDYTIRKVVIATGVVTTVGGTAGSDGSTDGTGAAARFFLPSGITTDGIDLFVADTFNHTIRAID
jgi:hypothetical protein